MYDFNNQELDPVKLKKLKLKIITLERENHINKILSNDEMVEKIRKLIEEEVRKCF
jgi:hypothetical protein